MVCACKSEEKKAINTFSNCFGLKKYKKELLT